jgi:hypothetical protein
LITAKRWLTRSRRSGRSRTGGGELDMERDETVGVEG